MAKISNTTTYPTKANPVSTDYVIGTDASSKETKTFTLQSIANLYGGSGSGTVTSVGLSAGTTGLSITSDTTNPITTTGTFTLAGTLAVANGGTGITSLGTRSQSLRVNTAADGLEYTDSNVVEIVRNNTSSTILKGQPLKVVGEVAGLVSVEIAQANISSNMPCIGVAAEDIPATSNGLIIQVGMLKNININTVLGTGAAAVGDIVYVAAASTPGNLLLTRDKPTGSNLIQSVGIITKTGATGDIQVTAIGRTNDLPNISQGSIWLGDSNGVPSALAIGANTYVLTSNGTTASWQLPTSGGAVDSVTTTDGTFINLTPNSATTGPVTVTADLSATGTASATTFLRGDNSWEVPGYAGHTIIDMADADTVTTSNDVNAAYLMTTTVDSNFTASSIKLQFQQVPNTTSIEVAIYTYVEQGINSTTSNVRLGHGSSNGSTTKRKVITLTEEDGQSLALTAGTNYVVALRCFGGNTGSGVFAASGKLSNVDYAATIDGNPTLPTELKTGESGNTFTATTLRPALTIY